ncbi:MAG: CBS domain-containing protein [Desulfobulbaceae bacterium]
MKVKDIMTLVTDHLSPEDTLQSAVVKMRTAMREDRPGVKGLVVLNERGELVGVLTIKDVLRAAIPVYLDVKLSRLSWDGMLEEMAKKVACRRVKEFMSKRVVTVPEDAPLMVCADLLIQEKMQRLPVLNKDNKVVGIVYIKDIFNVVSRIFLDQEGCKL